MIATQKKQKKKSDLRATNGEKKGIKHERKIGKV